MLMHVPDWRKALSELCRVTAHRLVFDYPAIASAAALQVVWRRTALTMGRRVEAYRVFRAGDIANELDRHGFRIISTHKQFVLPIAVHKAIGSAGFTRRLEGALAGAGLLRLAGSPSHRWQSGARPSYRCHRFTGGIWARTLARRGYHVRGPRAAQIAGERPGIVWLEPAIGTLDDATPLRVL